MVVVALTASPAHAWRGHDRLIVYEAPPGSRVYVDGKFIGNTPLAIDVPCDEVVDRRYRIESESCGTAEGIVNARVRVGVIVGMVFTLGILAIFSCPKYFVPVRPVFPTGFCAQMQKSAGSGGVLPPPQPIRRDEAALEPTSTLAERLRILKDLRDRGVLSEEEYERERQKALGDL